MFCSGTLLSQRPGPCCSGQCRQKSCCAVPCSWHLLRSLCCSWTSELSLMCTAGAVLSCPCSLAGQGAGRRWPEWKGDLSKASSRATCQALLNAWQRSGQCPRFSPGQGQFICSWTNVSSLYAKQPFRWHSLKFCQSKRKSCNSSVRAFNNSARSTKKGNGINPGCTKAGQEMDIVCVFYPGYMLRQAQQVLFHLILWTKTFPISEKSHHICTGWLTVLYSNTRVNDCFI